MLGAVICYQVHADVCDDQWQGPPVCRCCQGNAGTVVPVAVKARLAIGAAVCRAAVCLGCQCQEAIRDSKVPVCGNVRHHVPVVVNVSWPADAMLLCLMSFLQSIY